MSSRRRRVAVGRLVYNLANSSDFPVNVVLQFARCSENVAVARLEVRLLCFPHLGDQVKELSRVHRLFSLDFNHSTFD